MDVFERHGDAVFGLVPGFVLAVHRDLRGPVHQLEHPRRRAERLDDGDEGGGDEKQTRAAVDGVQDERVELPDGHVALDGEQGAVPERRAEHRGRRGHHRAVEQRVAPPVLHLNPKRLVNRRREVFRLAILPREPPHRAYGAQRVLRHRGCLRERRLRLLGQVTQAPALPHGDKDQRGERRDDHQC